MNNQLKEELILSTHHFDKKIDDVIKQVNRLKTQGNKAGDGFNSSMGKMITKATGFNGSMGSLLGTVTKLSGALGAITTGVQLSEWFKSSVAEGIKLAQAGEGIRLAFERLNKGDLLENLRKETHGTVTDIELMKQAVKFNDFKLDIDQMGTFLAFAQQKAKDTGQSIDYMVDSIVTGLGRKSLPILDNLGLSAAEIKARMKDGGDMTKAVAEIIKEKMEEAGGYVETAADRAKQKEVELQNELEELGRTFAPLQETSDNFWHSIEIGALKAINSIRPLINEFSELGRIINNYENLGGKRKVDRMLGNLTDYKGDLRKNSKAIYDQQLQAFDDYINKIKIRISAFGGDRSSIAQSAVAKLQEQLKAADKMKADYMKGAKDLYLQSKKPKAEIPSSGTSSTNKGGKTNVGIDYAIGSVGYLENKISELQKKIKLQVDHESIKELQKEIAKTKWQLSELMQPTQKLELTNIKPNFASALNITKELQEFLDREPLEVTIDTNGKATLGEIAGFIDDISSSFTQLGKSLEMPALDVAGTIAQAIASVIQGYATATSQAATLGPWAWLGFGLTGLSQLAAIIASIHNLSGYANGGVIGGSSYGGDRLLARVNSGEAIVTQNQQKHLFELLNNGNTDNAINGGNVHFVIQGKELHGVLSNYNKINSKLR